MGALDGLRIADFSWVGAGPRSTKDLADNGATVIKIESRKRLDLGRMSPPFARGERKNPDASAFFAQTNTSKQSVTINLADPEGVAVAKRLVAWADVVVENFGPGYMERIGLGYDVLKTLRPDIILLSVSVAGRTGPMAGFRGYGNSAAAQSGHAALTGWRDTPPHMPPFAYGDVTAPMFATVAVLAALEHRERTGDGQHLDISQIEPMVHVIADLYARGGDEKPANDDPVMTPHGIYPVAGDDRWLAIALEHEDRWPALCAALGDPALASDARFADASARRANSDELDQRIAALTRSREADELWECLAAAGIAAAPALDGKSIVESEELAASGHFVRLDHPVLGVSAMPGPPMRFSQTPPDIRRSPCLGEHNHAVFVEMLGMDPAEVAGLQERGALA